MARSRWFLMPPHETPDAAPAAPEPSAEFDVYAVLRDHLKYVALIQTELARQRRQQQEMMMKVSELSSKVDTLISVATDIKSRADSASPSTGSPVGSFPTQEDDPEVERLAKRIDDAVAILQGKPTSSSDNLPGVSPVDPNAPAQPAQPDPAALATDINSPANPNAPV